MWNLSYRWQRHARVAAGIAVLLGAVAAALGVSRSAAALRTFGGVRELAGEVVVAHQQQIEVAVPAELATRVGTLVYRDREDGVAQVVGRVVDVRRDDARRAAGGREHLTIRLMGPLAEEAQAGGVLRGASSALDLRDAMRLLVSPNTPGDEALRARDAIWPSVQQDVLPAIVDNMIRETSAALGSLDAADEELLATALQALHEELLPLEDQLVDRLARRAWSVIGVKGFASGIWLSTTGKVQDQGTRAADWWWQLFGAEPTGEASERPFLSEETKIELQAALQEEVVAFWRENRPEIIAAVTRVIGQRRGDFEAAFSERWAGKLFERAVVPAWLAGEQQVLDAVQAYVNDFATRRLLTKAGGPRLLFAYALRSSLEISDDPLLIFSPGAGRKPGAIEYQPLLR